VGIFLFATVSGSALEVYPATCRMGTEVSFTWR